MRTDLLFKFRPSSDALVESLAALVDDSMLQEIAAADYNSEFEEHLAQLHRIRDERQVPAPMRWNPREVLSLTRWSEPDDKFPASTEQNRRAHIIRAFACAVLLRASSEPLNQGYSDGENTTLAQMLASLLKLEQSVQVAALRFLAWRLQDLTNIYEEEPFYILAFLVQILRTRAEVTDTELQEIIAYLFERERQVRQNQFVMSDHPEHWLLGLTNFDQRHEIWQQIGKEIATFSEVYRDTYLKIALLNIANLLVDNLNMN